jgi:2,3,4,5-tetrahydropyridine-2-carboxylate N-succinyltransferase
LDTGVVSRPPGVRPGAVWGRRSPAEDSSDSPYGLRRALLAGAAQEVGTVVGVTDSIAAAPDPSTPAWGAGLATVTASGQVLDTWFPAANLGLGEEGAGKLAAAVGASGSGTFRLTAEQAAQVFGPGLAGALGEGALPGVEVVAVAALAGALSDAPADAHDAYLRLHLLSHRLVRPHGLSLEGLFGLLTNVAWTSAGPCPVERVDELAARERAARRHLHVYGIDKFPRMADYVAPSGVRIADANRVRLGAHLAPGTTVMHEGFVNFNAGTLGHSMVEGRISAGVVVGNGSDIGGGSSIMGTLSGGGQTVISIGEGCLLGANAGLGISLGNDCVVEAGMYLTAGSKVRLPDGSVVKAAELSGANNMLFWRNSLTGALEAKPRTGSWGGLNAILHAN